MKKYSLFMFFFSMLLGEEHINKLVQEVLVGRTDSAAIYLPELDRIYPNNPNLLFLKALMTTNGDDAKKIFVDLYNKHPTSQYGDDAVMKVAEFYYAAGLYGQSAEWLKKMPLYYSRSEHIERALKLFLNSLVISGHQDSAIFYSRVFNRQFPSLDFDVKINEIIMENKQESNQIQISLEDNQKEQQSSRFSLQSGAYSISRNAEDQKLYLIMSGYNARVIKLYRNKKDFLYAVRIGYYNSKIDANKVAEEIKKKLAINTIVITNE